VPASRYSSHGSGPLREEQETYRGYVRKHVHPFLCRFGINDPVFDAELFDSFYAELGRCREHCRPGHTVDHYTDEPHRCTTKCRPHVCVPLADAAIRKIHFILKGEFDRAARRQGITVNPIVFAQVPQPASGNPDPPSVQDAMLLVDAAWTDAYYGPLVWFAATIGARLGELCALRWSDLEISHQDNTHVLTGQDPMECWAQGCRWTLVIERSIEQVGLEGLRVRHEDRELTAAADRPDRRLDPSRPP